MLVAHEQADDKADVVLLNGYSRVNFYLTTPGEFAITRGDKTNSVKESPLTWALLPQKGISQLSGLPKFAPNSPLCL